jgi:hypothetical protein
MNRIIFPAIVLIFFSTQFTIAGFDNNDPNLFFSKRTEQDTLLKNQLLYRGVIWTNKFHSVKENQFLLSDLFLPGTVSVGRETFKNLRIKYDIYLDEIITPLNGEEILQLNKEMVDSFSIKSGNKSIRLINIKGDTTKVLTGYVNELYNSKTALYVKYVKNILPFSSTEYNGEFSQTNIVYFKKGMNVYQIKRKGDLFRVLNEKKPEIRKFISDNKLKFSVRSPESLIAIIKFYDSISQ